MGGDAGAAPRCRPVRPVQNGIDYTLSAPPAQTREVASQPPAERRVLCLHRKVFGSVVDGRTRPSHSQRPGGCFLSIMGN